MLGLCVLAVAYLGVLGLGLAALLELERSGPRVACVIVSNADDLAFAAETLRATRGVFAETAVAVGTRSWDYAVPEDPAAVATFERDHVWNFPDVRLVRYEVAPEAKDPVAARRVSDHMYWEAHARRAALRALRERWDYVVLLDADEVLDGRALAAWLRGGELTRYRAVTLRNYWYFRERRYRAVNYEEDSVVVLARGAFAEHDLFADGARSQIFERAAGPKARRVGPAEPMVHHYSWVRSEDAMLRKVRAWGHRGERDWEELVRAEFRGPFRGTDFVKGLRYVDLDA